MNENLNDVALDIIDLQLLDALQRDAAISNQALADKVHVSPPTCLRRIKRLRDLGSIESQVAILSGDALAQKGFLVTPAQDGVSVNPAVLHTPRSPSR